jgi:hypothetical protein
VAGENDGERQSRLQERRRWRENGDESRVPGKKYALL